MANYFRALAVGDHAFTIVRSGKRRYAVREEVISVARDTLRTLPCYADGTPMIYFGSTWRRRSGWEAFPPSHRPRQRLVRELPEGVAVPPAPAKPMTLGQAA